MEATVTFGARMTLTGVKSACAMHYQLGSLRVLRSGRHACLGEFSLAMMYRLLELMARFRLVHLMLFALRCRMAFCSHFWKGPWNFPNGQLTFEVSVKFFKEPQRPREVGEDAV